MSEGFLLAPVTGAPPALKAFDAVTTGHCLDGLLALAVYGSLTVLEYVLTTHG